MKSSVMKLAHKIKSTCESWSQALKFAWNKIKLENALKTSCCAFTFKKKSTGEETMRIGTKNTSLLNYEFKGGWTSNKWYIVTFWDTIKVAWRSLDVRTLVSLHF